MIINNSVYKYLRGVASAAAQLGAPEVVVGVRPYHIRFVAADDFNDAEWVINIDADVPRGGRVTASAVAAPTTEILEALEEVERFPLRLSVGGGIIRFEGPHGATEVRGREITLPREVHVGGFSSIFQSAEILMDVDEFKNTVNSINTEETFIYLEKDGGRYSIHVTDEHYRGAMLRNSGVENIDYCHRDCEGHYSTGVLKTILTTFSMRDIIRVKLFEKEMPRRTIPDIIEPYPPLILQAYWRCFGGCGGVWGVYFEVNSHYAPLPPLPYF
jgi:hypothetical protein